MIQRKWHWDHAIKFAGWQHPAMGRGERFDEPGITDTTYILTVRTTDSVAANDRGRRLATRYSLLYS